MENWKQTVLVTGGNRGIGLQVAKDLFRRGFTVYLGSRDLRKGEESAREILSDKKSDGKLFTVELDVADSSSCLRAADRILTEQGGIFGLINNAGIFLDGFPSPLEAQEVLKNSKNMRRSPEAVEETLQRVRETLEVNTLGALRLLEAFSPAFLSQKLGRIVQVSSGMGQLDEMEGGSLAYRVSKTALNALTKIFENRFAGTEVAINSICPGWVRTDMGGKEAHRSLEEGADTIVWLLTDAPAPSQGGPTGRFLRDREIIPW